MKPIVVWCSDLHINEMSSLCPPHFRRDEGHEHKFSPDISKLWDAWQDAWKVVRSRKRETIVIFGGEFADLDAKKRTNHIVTQNRANVKEAVAECLQPVLKTADQIFVLRGTEAHSDLEASFDEEMAQDIRGVPVWTNPITGEKSSWTVRVNIAGKRFNLAHHCNMGNTELTEKSAANKIAIEIKRECDEWGEPLPDWVLRGHVHRVSDSGISFKPMRVVTAPCWSLANPHIHRIGAGNRRPQIGLIVIDLEKNEPEWIRYEVKREAYYSR